MNQPPERFWRRILAFGAVVAFSLALNDNLLAAQEPAAIPSLASSQPQVDVMVLGVFHFHNPNADYAQFEGIDVLETERQEEIGEVIDGLEGFRPTKIAVERPVAEADSLNAAYRRYRNGDLMLTRNEVHQLGFRLADRLRHERVHPVDYRQGFRLDSILAWARAHDPGHVQAFERYISEIVNLMNTMQRDESIGENLWFLNQPANVMLAHEPYAVQATIGEGANQIGARMVAGWYERNLHIFANLAHIAEEADRILFIVGVGHSPILRHLVESHPSMTLVEAADYLPQTDRK